ncbi:MAG TPA: extracellular solute-binding protein [Clostridiales bacterium]|nr:extracellular solute-binding protein [Clostridiales bacterium]
MFKKHRITLTALIFALLISILAGCSSPSANDPSQKPNDVTDENKPVTISILMQGISQMSGVQDDPVTKYVAEKTGITIDVTSDAGMNLDAELNAMIASDSLPDIIMAITPEQRKLLHDTDSIIPLDDLVQSYGGNITSKEEGRFALDYSRKFYSRNNDGKLYFINVRAGQDYNAGFPTVAPYIRWDVYEKIGMPKVENMDDLLNVLKQMQDAYPETEDGKKVYAISGFLADAAWNTFSLTAAEAFIGFRKLDMYGLLGAMIDEPTKMINAMDGEDAPTWQLIRYFNKAYQMGILDPEVVTMKFDQWFEKVTAGQVLYAPLGVADVPIMNDPDKTFLPVKFENFVNDSFTCSYMYSQGGASYAITKSCKNPERAMQLLDFAWSYEGALAFANGVEGDTWETVDGVRNLKADIVEAYNNGDREGPLFSTFFGPFMNEDKTPIILRNSKAYFEKYKTTGIVKSYLEHYNIKAPIDNFNVAKHYTWDEAFDRCRPAYEGDLIEIDNRVREYVLTNIPRLVIAESDEEFEAQRQKFMDDIIQLGANQLVEYSIPNYEKAAQELAKMKEAAAN